MSYRWKRYAPIIIFFILLSQSGTEFVRGNGALNLDVRRTFGIGLGNNIQGTFTLYGSGSSEFEWDNLSITFNKVEVAFSEDDEITFQFKTKEYESGELNITLWGYYTNGTLSFTSRTLNILRPWVSALVITFTIVLVVGAGTYKYGPRIRNYIQKKKKERNNKEDEDERE